MIDTTGFVMFLHVGLVVAGLMMAALLHLALIQLRRAEVAAETRPWVPVIRRIEPLLPWAALAMFGTGAWLIHLSGGEVTWGQGWIVTSIVALVVAEGVGGMLSKPSRSLTEAVLRAPDGLITTDLRSKTRDPALWYGSHFITAVFFGIIYLMTAKPAGALAPVVAVVVAAMIGLLTAVPFVRNARGRPAVNLPDFAGASHEVEDNGEGASISEDTRASRD